jgi:F-type H+-transporting ATPase subunit gamma
MASLKQLKDRIVSVKSTKKITQAMKVVSASKLKKAKKAFESNMEYVEQMNILARNVFDNISDKDLFPLIFGRAESEPKGTLIIIFGSNKGLCGAFNSGLVRHLRNGLSSISGGKKNVICIGKKVYDALKYNSSMSVELFKENNDLTVDDVRELTKSLIERFYLEEFDSCVVFYNEFVSTMTQKSSSKNLIPLWKSEDQEETKVEGKKDQKNEEEKILFENEPEIEEMANELAEQYIIANIFSTLLETASGEQGARMTAMDSANRNAEKIIKKITTVYNRTRQAAVTNELIEIISGMEAISKN